MLNKEELRQAYGSDNHLTDEQLNGMVDNTIEELYGSQEEYERRIEEHKEHEAQQFKPEFDEEAYNNLQRELEEEDGSIKNPEALDEYLKAKAYALSVGHSQNAAECQARSKVLSKYGNAAFEESENDPLDAQVARLAERGMELSEHEKRLIKANMRTYGLTVAEAMKRVAKEQQEGKNRLESEIRAAGGREAEYYEALSPSDRQALQGLKGAQPESNWTARKYYKMFNDGKGLPPRKAESKKEPEEEMVPRAVYEAERERYKKVIEEYARMQVEKENRA